MRKNMKRICSIFCTFSLALNLVPSVIVAKDRHNLLLNPGFEDSKIEWDSIEKSGIQTNNPHTGTRGFYLDPGSKNQVEQTIIAPFSGRYKASAFISTGGSGSKLGIKHVNGDIIEEITIPSGANYATQHELPPVELKQGEEVKLYSSGGASWTNGDDFVFEYGTAQVLYNLLKGYDLSGNSPEMVRVPRDGDYIFSANIKSMDDKDVTIHFGDEVGVVKAGESKEVRLVTMNRRLGDEVEILIEGNYSIQDANMYLDLSKIPNVEPVAEDIKVEGIVHSGTTLLGTYTFTDPDGNQAEGPTEFKWLSSDSAKGKYNYIEGADKNSLTLDDQLEGKFIKFEVTPVDDLTLAGEPVQSQEVGPIEINWVRNPGLEIEKGPSAAAWSGKNGGQVARDENIARAGFRFAKIPKDTPTAEVSYKIKAEKTANYVAGAWVKTENGGELGVRIVGDKTPLNSTLIIPSDSFKFVEIGSFPVEKNSQIEVYIKGTEGCSEIIADDFQLIAQGNKDMPEYANVISFDVKGQVGETIISNKEKEINFSMPYGTDIRSLKVLAEASENAIVNPELDSTIDFSSPVTITVSNGSVSNEWIATCTVLEKNISLKSDNKLLQDSFNWAVDKTNQFVMTGKNGLVNKDENTPFGTDVADYIPSYWAGYYDRTAFYSRDFVHQAVGAQIVGLKDENYSMFSTFAENATEERKWYTPWSFNFDGSTHHIDYRHDNSFVREVPAQFELVEKAYKQYLWSGDDRYIKDPVMWNFYTKVMTDYIALHDTNQNGVAEGVAKGIFDGSCTYNERGDEPIIEAGDSIGSQYQATLAYAEMLKARGEEAASKEWFEKAAELKRYFNEEWSVYKKDSNGMKVDEVDSNGIYARGLTKDGSQYNDFGKENSWFMPMKLITEPGERNDAYLEFIADMLADGIGTGPHAPHNIEAYTYIPDTLFPYNRNDEAWKWMKYIMERKDLPHERPSQGTNGDYPEISYTFVSHAIEGLMGIEVNAPEHVVATAGRLPGEIGWVEADYISMGDHKLNIRHDGLNRTTLKNDANSELTWEARFYGDYNTVLVDGVEFAAQQKEINGVLVSYVVTTVSPGGTVVTEAVSE